MSATQAKIGFGGRFLLYDANSPGSYISIGEVRVPKPPSISRDAVDATHSESPNGYKEFIAGLKDGGEASCEISLIPGSDGMTLLLAQLASDDLSGCKIIVPTTPAYAWTFDAVLTGFESEQPIDGVMIATVTFKVSGKPVLALDA